MNIKLMIKEMFLELKRDKTISLLILLSILLNAWFFFTPIREIVNAQFLVDDSFYYFKVAKNIAIGNGATFDGINPTNGFQPLGQLLLVPIFYLFGYDLLLPIRFILVSQILLNTLTMVLIYKFSLIAGLKKHTAIVISVIWLAYPLHYLAMMRGMESTLYALLLMITIYFFTSKFDKPLNQISYKHEIIFGSLLGLTFLTRLDAVFLIFTFLMLILFSKIGTIKEKLGSIVTVSIPIAVISLPYLMWNYFLFGALTPISGRVKHYAASSAISQLHELNGFDLFYRVINNLYFDNCIFTTFRVMESISIAVCAASIILTLIFIVAWRKDIILKFKNPKIYPLMIFVFILFVFYKIYYFEVYTNLGNTWTLIPQFILFTFLFGMIFEIFIDKTQKIFGFLGKNYRSILTILLCVAIISSLGVFLYFMINTGEQGQLKAHVAHAQWLNENTNESDLIGVWDAGIIGYFSERKVVNLDGLVNSPGYFEYIKNGNITDYLDEIKIDYITNRFYEDPHSNPESRIGRKEWDDKLQLIYHNPTYVYTWNRGGHVQMDFYAWKYKRGSELNG